MRLLFCANPLTPRRVDAAYQDEYEDAKAAGADIALLDFEVLMYENDAVSATARILAADTPARGVYRGWMLTTLRLPERKTVSVFSRCRE